jgi:hypothetical protein
LLLQFARSQLQIMMRLLESRLILFFLAILSL